MALQFQPGQLAGMFPGIISGYGGGTFNPGRGGLEQVPNPQQMPQAAPEPKKKGLFSKDGDGWKILGIIGDALQVGGGGQATYAAGMRDLNERIAKERQFQERLAAEIEQRKIERQQAVDDQKTLIDYRNANPTPDSFQKALAAAGIDPNSDEARGLARKRAEMLTNPVQLVPDGMGGYSAVRPNEAAGGMPQGYDPSEWELVPGDAGGNASGGF